MHRLEVNEPGAPLLREGRTASWRPPTFIAWPRSGAVARCRCSRRFTGHEANAAQTDAAVTRITCFDFDGADMLVPAGTVTLAGAVSVLASAPSRLYRASRVSGSAYRIQRFALTSRCEGQRLSPDDEVDVLFPATTTATTGLALAVDGTADAWLLAEALYEAENTITDFDTLNDQLLTIRNEHIAKEYEEITKGLCCYAVPLEFNGNVIAALSVSIPKFRATTEKLNLVTELFIKCPQTVQ